MTVGEANFVEYHMQVGKHLVEYPEMGNTHKFYEMSPDEKQQFWFKKLHFIWTKLPGKRKMYFTSNENLYFQWYFSHLGQHSLWLHGQMFTHAMHSFSTDVQREKWMPLI